MCVQNKAKSEENERSDTKGFSSSVNKITTIITSFNKFVADGPAYRTTYSIVLSEIRVPFSVCRISVRELTACGAHTQGSLVSHGVAAIPSLAVSASGKAGRSSEPD